MEQSNLVVQSVLVKKEHGITLSDAQKIIKSHNFKPKLTNGKLKIHETENYFRARVREPDYEHFEYRIKKLEHAPFDLIVGFRI